ncbi:hypothetical protein MKW98_003718 [Papaver atlanticum]|uniref:Fe2OG dioxygenase domain-containing protein n=1 Tax=Papaver atlanticum TaxID=357466 RepID=A0AAD4SJW5_9MAGN|nr:hypothetical protein MKW98_003718 [Papaver atlanticum]
MEKAYINGEKLAVQDESCYDRIKELKAIDETKAGVKGIADAGLLNIPRVFIRPPEELAEEENLLLVAKSKFHVPMIDLEDMENRRKEIVNEIRLASASWGFFQLLNHGIPETVMDGMILGVARFHEQDTEVKKQFYTREFTRKVQYTTNFDWYQTKTAKWKDSFMCSMLSPDLIDPEELPAICRDIMLEYTEHVRILGNTLIELLSEALGIGKDHLIRMGCTNLSVLGNYYPACPQPKLTMGSYKHTDSSFFTLLIQDNIGGLQVLYQNHWVDVKPKHGAIVVNIGDLLQLISNGKFKSAEHRVLANQVGPRVSVASFFSTSSVMKSAKVYNKDLISDEDETDLPVCSNVRVPDYLKHYIKHNNSEGNDGVHSLSHFKF